MLTQSAATRKDMTTGKSDMQHRHFTTIAETLRDLSYVRADAKLTTEQVEFIANHFADHLRSTNPRFDRDRFLRACKA